MQGDTRPNPTTRKGWPHHRGLPPLLFSNSGVGSFRKSNHLQMSLQRQHFLLSYLKTLSVGQAEVWTGYLPLSRPVLFQLSSRLGDTNSTPWKEPYIPRVFHFLLLFLLEVLWEQLFWNNRKEQLASQEFNQIIFIFTYVVNKQSNFMPEKIWLIASCSLCHPHFILDTIICHFYSIVTSVRQNCVLLAVD